MLIKFQAQNFRSLRDCAELSLVAINSYKENKEQLISNELPGLKSLNYLKAIGIYGPNASGKSTLLKAFSTMRGMVCNSNKLSPNESLPYHPFLLNEQSSSEPTKFFVAFMASGARYEYSFSYVERRIICEELLSFPKGYPRVLFTREDQKGAIKLTGSSHITLPATLRKLLNDNVLLVSLLAHYPNYRSAAAIAPVYMWFEKQAVLFRGPSSNPSEGYPFSGEILDGKDGTENQRFFIQQIMSHSDTGIESPRVEKKELSPENFGPKLLKMIRRVEGEDQDLPKQIKSVVFDHAANEGKVTFPIEEESDGTFQLFRLSGHIAKALEYGSVLFIDEIDASLHPTLVREVVRCFLDPSSNSQNAQLIFTAHDTSLLKNGFLRRDQVWLTKKEKDGSTNLRPLSNYSPRKDDRIDIAYLTGRYSATPAVPECFGWRGWTAEPDHGPEQNS